MPPPRRQNPATPARKPRVAGRAPAASSDQPAAAESPAESPAESQLPEAFIEKPSRNFFGRKTDPDTPSSDAEVTPIEDMVELGKSDAEESSGTESSGTESSGTESSGSETTRKKTPAPYKLAKPRIEPAAPAVDTAPEPGPHRRKVDLTTKILAALAVVLAIVAVVAYQQPGTPETTNAAWVDDEATNEVTASTVTALQTVFSYKAATIEQDQDAARTFLSGDRLEEYNATADQTKSGVLQTMTTATAKVTDIGVTTLQGDRAELVASMDISANQQGVDQGTVQTPVVVTMSRVDGRWVITQIDSR